MDGSIQVYYGNGRGKTTAALGLGIRAAGVGKQVIMVQFLKKKHSDTLGDTFVFSDGSEDKS